MTEPPHASKRHRQIGLVALLVVTGVTAWWLGRDHRSDDDAPPPDLMPGGRWHRVSESQRQSAQERAQLLSLGYLSGRFLAPAGTGIAIYDLDRVWPGVNLYTSGDAPEVRLIDLEGETLHRWSCAYRRAFPDGFETGETVYIRRARLLPGGDLVVLYQGGGVARLDAESNVVWATAEPAFNDLAIGDDGVLRVIGKRPIRLGALAGFDGDPDREVLEDSVAEIAVEDGEVLRRISILQALWRSPFKGVLDPLPSGPDILHGNTVRRLSEEVHAPFAAGQLLVSLREIDTLAVIDPSSERAVWAARGPWRRQHEPTLLPRGRLLVFDNRGAGDGSSRALELTIDLGGSGQTVWEYGQIDSPQAGTVRRLPNGNTLITESERGRALEVTASGEVVWEFMSPHRAGRAADLVATLFELERYPVEGPWLERLVSRRDEPPARPTADRE